MAVGLMGVGLTVLGVILAYIWKSNGKMQERMMLALERIKKGQENIALMILNQTKILERIEKNTSAGSGL